ncbi:two-component sensor histidine kinase [Pseudoalteromonas luteoviolacea]|uniref:ATP-binding protein n=1 Tax=Pseudoalteromonas luteoviolacea TaxID=43657 RepID=UPI001B39D793|nr:ATP-binding protein [Pseudoalteromonas luteoviolacea]MBQ4877875.1 two-component sensor histidine kinase [Pseudoalteromonas luteoviolacea]MBQ4906910.1 two-component sensor histidine kinase [Pseudoalteromonas luteoviolacea]
MWRFVIALVSVLIIASIALGQVFDVLYSSEESAQSDVSEQLALALPLLKMMASQESHLVFDKQLQQRTLGDRNASVRLYSVDEYPLPIQLQQQLQKQEPVFLETQDHVKVHLLTSDQTILVYQYDKLAEQDSYRLSLTLIFYFLLVIILVLFLTPFVRRLMHLSDTAAKFGDGELDVRLKVGTLWYIRDIELSFNQMANKINLLMDDIKLLAGGLSHELRTPLARIRMGLDTIVETQDEALRTKYEARVNQQLDDMEGLLIHMLDFARLQHSLDEATPQPLDLVTALPNLVDLSFDGAVELNIILQQAFIHVDQRYFTMAISNIIDNALKYGHSRCVVTVTQEKNEYVVAISDDGNGIDESKAAEVFKPFVRLNRQHCTGFGIGLAFSAKIIARYRGEIFAGVCAELGGACITVKFPAL